MRLTQQAEQTKDSNTDHQSRRTHSASSLNTATHVASSSVVYGAIPTVPASDVALTAPLLPQGPYVASSSGTVFFPASEVQFPLVMPQYVMRQDVMQPYLMRQDAMQQHVIQQDAMLQYVVQPQQYGIQQDAMQQYVVQPQQYGMLPLQPAVGVAMAPDPSAMHSMSTPDTFVYNKEKRKQYVFFNFRVDKGRGEKQIEKKCCILLERLRELELPVLALRTARSAGRAIAEDKITEIIIAVDNSSPEQASGTAHRLCQIIEYLFELRQKHPLPNASIKIIFREPSLQPGDYRYISKMGLRVSLINILTDSLAVLKLTQCERLLIAHYIRVVTKLYDAVKPQIGNSRTQTDLKETASASATSSVSAATANNKRKKNGTEVGRNAKRSNIASSASTTSSASVGYPGMFGRSDATNTVPDAPGCNSSSNNTPEEVAIVRYG
ncbi:MAG: hypothetical protein COB66_03575 [Coxiella sp. (in: Bacteria)]|nr:MAG: hypothetical protein COB66_03575 [Coxiella sp. (in: g-proteobacteria)]